MLDEERLPYSELTEDDGEDLLIFGFLEGMCAGCDDYTKLDDSSLCEECAGKLDRDLIREREWDRSMTGWACPKEDREDLRNRVIKKYGKSLELIAPSEPAKPGKTKAKRGKRKSTKKMRRKARHERYLREGK